MLPAVQTARPGSLELALVEYGRSDTTRFEYTGRATFPELGREPPSLLCGGSNGS